MDGSTSVVSMAGRRHRAGQARRVALVRSALVDAAEILAGALAGEIPLDEAAFAADRALIPAIRELCQRGALSA